MPTRARKQETRSRSPSPLSLRDPQDYGEYQMGESSDDDDDDDNTNNEQGNARRRAVVERPARPLPLSLAAASLDLPSLGQSSSSSPLVTNGSGASRRFRWGMSTSGAPAAAVAEDAAPADEESATTKTPPTSPTKATTLPLKQRTASEAPFDEGSNSPQRTMRHHNNKLSVTTATATTQEHTARMNLSPASQASRSGRQNNNNNPLLEESTSPASVTSSQVVHIATSLDEEEPPACELQEPPSLRTFRRPLSSAVPPVTSPPPPAAKKKKKQQQAIVVEESNKVLPFEDECEDEMMMMHSSNEEKKTNDPGPTRPGTTTVRGHASWTPDGPAQDSVDWNKSTSSLPDIKRKEGTATTTTTTASSEMDTKALLAGTSQAVAHARSLLRETSQMGSASHFGRRPATTAQQPHHRSPSDPGVFPPPKSKKTERNLFDFFTTTNIISSSS